MSEPDPDDGRRAMADAVGGDYAPPTDSVDLGNGWRVTADVAAAIRGALPAAGDDPRPQIGELLAPDPAHVRPSEVAALSVPGHEVVGELASGGFGLHVTCSCGRWEAWFSFGPRMAHRIGGDWRRHVDYQDTP